MSAAAASPAGSSFTIHRQQGLARVGTLRTSSGLLPTPNGFFYSKKGAPAHLTPDLLATLPDLRALQVPIAEFVHSPGEVAMQQLAGRLHSYVRLPGHILYLSPRDPLVDGLGTANDHGVSVNATQGATRLSPAQYAALSCAYEPDIVCSLSDEIASAVASNRAKKSSQRSVMWVDDMQGSMAAKARPGKTLFFAAVQGGADLQQRQTSCYQLSLRAAAGDAADAPPSKRIDGFVLGGLHSGEDAAMHQTLLRSLVSSLPASKPRVLSAATTGGSGAPDAVLRGVEEGVDLFEVTYPHQLTLLGQASVFQLDGFEDAAKVESAVPLTKLHLRDTKYAHDKKPLLPGCRCFTCQNHTRAYIHHLLNVHEMLAPVLLDVHNLFHYTKFLAKVREHLSDADDTAFARFKADFLRAFLPAADVVPLARQPAVHAHQVGRATLGPFSSVVALSPNGGEFAIRRILPKDNPHVERVIKSVLVSYGLTGEGYAIHDAELTDMWQAYEAPHLNTTTAPPPAPPTNTEAMEDVGASTTVVSLAPLRSAYFVVCSSSDDSTIVGGCGVAPLVGCADGSVAELRKMYLLETARGRGVGSQLIALAIEQARRLAFKQIYLETVEGMVHAIKLYEKFGFRRIPNAMGNTGHQVCAVRYLLDL